VTDAHDDDLAQRSPTRASVRKLLETVLIADSDLDAFALDYFPAVKGRFTNTMDRVAKRNCLVEHSTPVEILRALRRANSQAVEEHAPLLLEWDPAPSETSQPRELEWYRGACVGVHNVGSGYLISPDLVATCFHVVSGVAPDAKVWVTFPGGTISAKIVGVRELADAAILRLDRPVLERHLRLRVERTNGVTWSAHGFPEFGQSTSAPSGRTIGGTVVDVHAVTPLPGISAIRLSPSQSDWAEGFSGAPVMVRGTVIGHITTRLIDPTGQGTISACPATEVVALLEEVRRSARDEASTRLDPPGLPYRSHDQAAYVHRDMAGKRALGLLADGRPVVLLGPEHFGKSFLLGWILQQLAGTGSKPHVITADIASFVAFCPGDQRSDGNTFLAWLIEQWLDGCCPPGINTDVASWTQGKLSWGQKFNAFAADYLDRGERFVFVIEHASSLHELPELGDGFFALLRSWAEYVGAPPWSRLSIILEISTMAALYSRGTNVSRSPFNTVPPITVDDFDLNQAMHLVRYHGLDWTEDDLGALMDHLGGHPYLLRMAMHEANQQRLATSEILRHAAAAAGIFEWYLDRLVVHIQGDTRLVEALKHIITLPGAAIDDLGAIDRLSAAGIIKQVRRGYRTRSRLYEVYLTRRLQISGGDE
jgi:hypothetical protein